MSILAATPSQVRCLDPDTYRRAIDFLKRLIPDRLPLRREHFVLYLYDSYCSHVPRAQLYVDISDVTIFAPRTYACTAFVSLYFDKEDKPVAHVYKIFRGVDPEQLMRELAEYYQEFKPAILTSSTSSSQKFMLTRILRGDEVYRVVDLVLRLTEAALEVYRRHPECFIEEVNMALRFYQFIRGRSAKVFYEDPDVLILRYIDVDRLSTLARQLVEKIVYDNAPY